MTEPLISLNGIVKTLKGQEEPRRILDGVDFCRDYDHGLRGQILRETGELAHDNFEIVHRIAAGFGNVDKMHEQPRAFDMFQKFCA